MRKLVAVVLTLLCISRAAAQADCPAIVSEAIAATGEACTTVDRNQACYGNINLSASFRPNVTATAFEAAGDIAQLVDVAGIALNPLDVEEQTWGIAVLRVQANLPDTLPGQNVTMLLFGDVQVTNTGTLGSGTTLSATANTGANIRRSPSQNGTIIGSLISGDSVNVVGRLDDSSWLQIQMPSGDGTGWVFAELLNVDGDVTTVTISDPSVVQYGPMQAFYLTTGVGEPACSEAPDSGVLVQTPTGGGRIVLNVNDATITLGSTAFLQAEPGGDMVISLVEGGAQVETEWDVEYVPAGARVRVPLRDDGHVEVADFTVEPFNRERMLALPISLLPRAITIPYPLQPEEIEIQRATPTLIPPTITPTPAIATEGWTVTQTVLRDTCFNSTNSSFGVLLTFDAARTLIGLNWNGMYFPMAPSGLGYVGTYTDSNSINYNISLVFQGPTFFTADVNFSRPSVVAAGCAGILRWDGRFP
ncbi:MAG: SH3 domain-containing protein [Anaerolineae bacterium]